MSEPVIIILGGPGTGVRATGPFPDVRAARKFGRALPREFDWWVTSLYRPDTMADAVRYADEHRPVSYAPAEPDQPDLEPDQGDQPDGEDGDEDIDPPAAR